MHHHEFGHLLWHRGQESERRRASQQRRLAAEVQQRRRGQRGQRPSIRAI